MISAEVKADIKQEIKELVAISCNFLYKVPSKLEIQSKTGVYFSFKFVWYSNQLDVVR